MKSWPSMSSSTDEVDPRRIVPEAKSMMYSGQALDKTMMRSFGLKPVTTVRPRPQISNSNLLEEDSASLTSNSIASQSIQASDEFFINFDGVTFPLASCDKFLRAGWRAFSEFAAEPVNPMDKCDYALPMDCLPACITKMSVHVPRVDFDQAVENFKITEDMSLTWTQFKDFAAFLFTPLLREKLHSLGLPLRSNLLRRGTDVQSSPDNRGGDAEDSQARRSLSLPALATTPPIPSSVAHPYDIMLRKQRYNSCIELQKYQMPVAEASQSHSKSVDIWTVDDHQVQESIIVPKSMVSDAAVSLFKVEHRSKRKTEAGFLCSTDSVTNGSRTADSSQLAESSGSQAATHISSVPRHMQPTEKSKVFALLNPAASYPKKWLKMKAQREERFERERRLKERKQIMCTINKTVIHSDKMTLQSNVALLEKMHKIDRESKYFRSKEREDISTYNKFVNGNEEAIRREQSARELKEALSLSVALARAAEREEREEKARNKPDSSIQKLSEQSSTQISVPTQLIDKIKNAKRYSEYSAAKKEARELYEKTISDRIGRYVQARTGALARAASVGAPVSLTPFRGDMFFSAESAAPTAGVASAVSLMYASAVSIDDSAGFDDSLASKPPSPYSAESNAFLKELAVREYLSRKNSEEMYDDKSESSADLDSAPDDSSWRTDPRLQNLGRPAK